MCRGNNGQDIFKDDKGRRLFLSTLEDVCIQTGWRIHAYVLMSNHYHLLLETPEGNLVAGMKWFQGTYTQRFNAMFKCRGHLFQGRYKALPIDTEEDASYLRCVADYIHLNPFRAGIAGRGLRIPLSGYRWSSFPAYVGKIRTVPGWLERERVLSACGIECRRGCYVRYLEFIEHRMEGELLSGESEELVERQLKRGWFVGGERFKTWLAGRIPSESDNLRGDQRRAHNEYEAERLFARALDVLNLSEEAFTELKSNSIEKLGDRSNVSRALRLMRQSRDRRIEKFKEKMTQCTG
jgi:REP element-mobilizing transposase RayT